MHLDTNVIVALASAFGAILAGWFALRGNWDRRLLATFSDEMKALRGRVVALETRVSELQKELDVAQSALYIAQRDLDSATQARDRFAEQNTKQAAHIITLEANVARLQVQVEALNARLRLAGETPPAGEDLFTAQNGDVI